jgi:hypothetical protein
MNNVIYSYMTIISIILLVLCLTVWLDLTIKILKIAGMVLFYFFLAVLPVIILTACAYFLIKYNLEELALTIPLSVVLFLGIKRRFFSSI